MAGTVRSYACKALDSVEDPHSRRLWSDLQAL